MRTDICIFPGFMSAFTVKSAQIWGWHRCGRSNTSAQYITASPSLHTAMFLQQDGSWVTSKCFLYTVQSLRFLCTVLPLHCAITALPVHCASSTLCNHCASCALCFLYTVQSLRFLCTVLPLHCAITALPVLHRHCAITALPVLPLHCAITALPVHCASSEGALLRCSVSVFHGKNKCYWLFCS